MLQLPAPLPPSAGELSTCVLAKWFRSFGLNLNRSCLCNRFLTTISGPSKMPGYRRSLVLALECIPAHTSRPRPAAAVLDSLVDSACTDLCQVWSLPQFRRGRRALGVGLILPPPQAAPLKFRLSTTVVCAHLHPPQADMFGPQCDIFWYAGPMATTLVFAVTALVVQACALCWPAQLASVASVHSSHCFPKRLPVLAAIAHSTAPRTACARQPTAPADATRVGRGTAPWQTYPWPCLCASALCLGLPNTGCSGYVDCLSCSARLGD